MADIFFSYAREDRATVARIVSSLKSEGFSVWWDNSLVAGEQFDNRTREEIDGAACMVVAWSRAAIASRYVPDEASIGMERKILVPISLDGTRPPIGFRSIHAVQMMEGSHDERMRELVSGIQRVQSDPLTKPLVRPPVLPSLQRRSLVSQIATNFLDGSKGKNVPIEEFSSLFRMEGHTGIFGIFFTIGWFVTGAISLPDLGRDSTFILSGILICIAFLVLLFGSMLLSGSYSKERSDRPADKALRDFRDLRRLDQPGCCERRSVASLLQGGGDGRTGGRSAICECARPSSQPRRAASSCKGDFQAAYARRMAQAPR